MAPRLKAKRAQWTRVRVTRHAERRWAQRFAPHHSESLANALGNAHFWTMLSTERGTWYVYRYDDVAFLFSWREGGGRTAALDSVWPTAWIERKLYMAE